MKKGTRIGLIVAGVLAALVLILYLTGDAIATRIADSKARPVLQEQFGDRISYSKLWVSPWAGYVVVNDVKVDTFGVNLTVDRVYVSKRDYIRMARSFMQGDSTLIGKYDSQYHITVKGLRFLTPDSLTCIEMRSFDTEDGGPIEIEGLHVYNTVDRRELAVRMGEVPVTWADVTIDEVKTMPINLIRRGLALAGKEQIEENPYLIDSIMVYMHEGSIFRDARFKPKNPYPMPQEVLMAAGDLPVQIGKVSVKVDILNVEIATTHVNSGSLRIEQVDASMNDVKLKKGATIRCHVNSAHVDKQGKCKALFTMTLNQNCDFTTEMHVKDINFSAMDPLLKPLVGMTASASVDEISMKVHGDKEITNGTFCMLYHDFHVVMHRDVDVPYKILKQNGGFIESFANTMLPKQNPPAVGKEPRKYTVEWKRDIWSPFPLYMFGPCIDGVIKTMLPGLFIKSKVKDDKPKAHEQKTKVKGEKSKVKGKKI